MPLRVCQDLHAVQINSPGENCGAQQLIDNRSYLCREIRRSAEPGCAILLPYDL